MNKDSTTIVHRIHNNANLPHGIYNNANFLPLFIFKTSLNLGEFFCIGSLEKAKEEGQYKGNCEGLGSETAAGIASLFLRAVTDVHD
jgi:hypothetical protein